MFPALFMSSIVLGLSSSSPIANYWLSHPLPSLTAPLNLYHTQDGLGSYRYGYTGPHHAKTETRSNGVTQGGYSYIDANGILQSVAYTADDANGFRVRASNLPQQPSVASSHRQDYSADVGGAGKNHLQELEKNLNEGSSDLSIDHTKQHQRDTSQVSQDHFSESRNPFLLSGAEASRIEIPKPYASLLDQSDVNKQDDASLKIVDRNVVSSPYVVPVVPYRLLHSSLHHSQDSLGQYDYSYVGDTSSKTESRSLDGTTRGAYSYVDANGLLQQVHYIADHNGFRVLATNLPEA